MDKKGEKMKFTCEKGALQREIAFAQEIISTRNTISILSNVFLSAEGGSLSIKATDIKVYFQTFIPVDVQKEGSVTVYCDKFLTVLSTIPDGDIEIELDDTKVIIKPLFKKIKFQLRSISSDKFPEFPFIEDKSYVSIPARTIKEMIVQTIFAVSDDETRYFMNGVFFEKAGSSIAMVATDGRRLSFVKKAVEGEVPDFKGIIVPPKILAIINKHAGDENPVSIATSEKNIFVKFGNYSMSSVLIEGQFPNYQRVIPESQKYTLKVNRLELLEALKRISTLVEAKSRRTFLAPSAAELAISSEEGEIGTAKEEIPCEFDGPAATLCLNYKYLEDPLKVMGGEMVSITFTEAARAITVNAEPVKDYFHIVMPMQND
jgi:DNA polymerase-3 subunit beta